MKTLEERFWEKVDKNGPVPSHRPELGPCWIWTASLNKAGYGSFGVPGNTGARAHRVAFELSDGPIPDGMEVCHSCDQKPCVRRSHLFLGSHIANMLDMAAKGRATKRKGADHPQANSCSRSPALSASALPT